MKGLLKRTKSRNLEIFDLLCDRARELIFMSLEDDCSLFFYVSDLDEELLDMTPIEQIFYIANGLYATRNTETGNTNIICKHLELVPQVKIKTLENKYVVDFLIDTIIDDNKEILMKKPLVIELDGLEYHSKKKQINYDYRRENDLKLLGYDIIRFTGSQVYKDPYACLDIVHLYIHNMIKGE